MHRFRWPAVVAALTLIAVGVIASAASSQRAVTKTITPSPAWTSAQLSAPAGDNWLEYYGSLNGNRYSSLNQITTSNVSTLKQVWQMSLGTCTASIIAGDPVIPGAPRGATNNPTNCGSMESNPVAVDGVLYTINAPHGQVFAIDAATGNIIWTYTPSYAGEILNNGRAFSPGSGGRLPGVAVGEGKVFFGLQDGRVIALDQVSGQEVWETSVGSYKNNAKVSNAPIYVNGMVLVGDGSGDSGGNSPSHPGLQGRERRSHLDRGAPSRRPVSRATRPGRSTARAATAARSTAAARSGSPRSSTPSSTS